MKLRTLLVAGAIALASISVSSVVSANGHKRIERGETMQQVQQVVQKSQDKLTAVQVSAIEADCKFLLREPFAVTQADVDAIDRIRKTLASAGITVARLDQGSVDVAQMMGTFHRQVAHALDHATGKVPPH